MNDRAAKGNGRAKRGATLLSAIATILTLGCAPSLTDAEQSVYPTFSLVGELPDRVEELELTIESPDIDPVHEIIAAQDGPHIIELEPGEDRFIEVLTVDDVYSGSVTADFPAPGEYEVTIPMLPGPVIPDPGNERLVQIRDMSGAGRRELGADVLEGFEPRDAAYEDNDGSLWIANGSGEPFGLLRVNDLSDEQTIEGFEEDIGVDALALDSESDRVYVWASVPQADDGLYYVDLQTAELSDEPVIAAWQLAGEIVNGEGASAHGLDVDDDGYIVAAVNTNEFENWFWVVRIDPDSSEDMVVDSLSSEALGWENILPDPNDSLGVIRDVVVRGESVYATMAVDIDVEYDKMVRFESDFDPDSVEPVTLDGEEFLGPQRFVANRDNSDRIIVTDWRGFSSDGRLVELELSAAPEWTVFTPAEDLFAFFDLVTEGSFD